MSPNQTQASRDAQAGGRLRLEDIKELLPHSKAQLRTLGYVYVDELQKLTGVEIRAKLRGPAVFKNVMTVLGRAAEADEVARDLLILRDPLTGQEVGRVPRGVLRQIVALVGTARALSFNSVDDLKHALEVGQRIDPQTGQSVPFGWEDVARYRLETVKNQADDSKAQARVERAVAASGGASTQVLDEIDALVHARVEQYKQDFDVASWTTSDFEALWTLARVEIRLASLQRIQLAAVSGSKDAEQANKVRTEEAERLVNMAQKIRADLQISLKARAEARASTQADQVVTSLAARGKQLMREHMAIWQHCGVMQALFYPIFPLAVLTPTIRLRCARCGVEEDFVLVPPRVLDHYTEAGNFVPPDAPPGIFDREAK